MAPLAQFEERAALVRSRRRMRRGFDWLGLLMGGLGFLLALALGTAALSLDRGEPASSGATAPRLAARFALCTSGTDLTCVTDGDTFRYEGTRIRIADIDTPETRQAQCHAERALADRATRRLTQLLNAGPFTLAPADRDEDRYGRKLRIVMRGETSLGAILVAEGLARNWDGARHPWC